MPAMLRNTSTLTIPQAISRALVVTIAALLPTGASALSKTNSDGADLVYADMALSRGDCRGGAERYLKVALSSSDPKISERASEVAADCQHDADGGIVRHRRADGRRCADALAASPVLGGQMR